MLGRRVSIKFCGGCNPQINRAEIAREVGKHLSSHGLTVVFNSFDADFIIHLSGCSSNCAQKFSNSDIPCISVAGTMIDAMVVDESQIVSEIITRIVNLFKLKMKNMSQKEE